jgi:hypothetical protein
MPRYMVQRTFPDGLHIPIDPYFALEWSPWARPQRSPDWLSAIGT